MQATWIAAVQCEIDNGAEISRLKPRRCAVLSLSAQPLSRLGSLRGDIPRRLSPMAAGRKPWSAREVARLSRLPGPRRVERGRRCRRCVAEEVRETRLATCVAMAKLSSKKITLPMSPDRSQPAIARAPEEPVLSPWNPITTHLDRSSHRARIDRSGPSTAGEGPWASANRGRAAVNMPIGLRLQQAFDGRSERSNGRLRHLLLCLTI